MTLPCPTPQHLALAIAGEIAERGHYQQGCEYPLHAACIIVSNAYGSTRDGVRDEFINLLGARLGLEAHPEYGIDLGDIYKWNDSTPTSEVISTLRSLASA